jgi:hypothetical protein
MNPEQQQVQGVKVPDFTNIGETTANVQKSVADTVSNIGSNVTNISDTLGKTLDDFSSTSAADAGKEFLEANTIVAKFAFVIIVLIGFLFLMRLGMIVLSYIFSPSKSPYLVKGVLSGNSAKTIVQDPRTNDKTVFFSENERSGLEMTYSVWLNLNGIKNTTRLNHIFNKGSIDTAGDFKTSSSSENSINKTYNAPGLYVYRNAEGGNNLRVYMDSYIKTSGIDSLNEQVKSVDIINVPIKKWVNVVIRVENRVMDVYVNGTLTKRMDLESIPRQNFSDVYVCQNGGFAGSLSDLRYFNKSLNVFQINGIVGEGPNLKTSAESDTENKYPYYLSPNWYSSNN